MVDRALAGEVRAEGRVLTGTVMTYGEISPSHRERFMPGSLRRDGDPVVLDLDHDPLRAVAWIGQGLELEDSRHELRLRADLPRTPAADAALEGVRTGARRGLSVEFNAVQEHREAQTGIRVIEDSLLRGIGLVARPSYPGSSVNEIRRRPSGERIRGRVNMGRRLACRCRKNCTHVRIDRRAFDRALTEAEAGDREITAFFSGQYGKPIASYGSGLSIRRRDDRLEIEISNLPDTAEVRDFLETNGSAFYAFRPYFPDDESVFEVEDATAIFTEADLRAIEIAAVTGPTDGLEPVMVRRRERRRVWL